MQITKKVIDLQDSTDTCTVYYITDNEREIRITLINDKHLYTEIDEKNSSSKH